MYRRSRKYQEYVTKYAKARAAREEKRIKGIHPEYPSELPALRRLIKITDYDTSTPVTHRIKLYRSNRVNCHNGCFSLFFLASREATFEPLASREAAI